MSQSVTIGEAKALQAPPSRANPKAVGITGTQLAGGYITGEEQNAKLQAVDTRISAYRLMLDTNPVIQAIFRATLGTVLSARWSWVKPNPSASSAPVDFLNENFGFEGHTGRMSLPWEQQLSYMWLYSFMGFRYMEPMYKMEDGQVWLDVYADREPSAHASWVVNPHDGTFAGAKQYEVSSYRMSRGETRTLPASKLLLLTAHRTGSNFEGRGLLRPMYIWDRAKRNAFDCMGIGINRLSVGMPHVKTDYQKLNAQAGFAEDGDSGDDTWRLTQKANADEQARRLSVNELGFLSTPEGIDITPWGTDSFKPENLIATIHECDRQCYAAAQLLWLELGHSQSGSRSVGEVLESFYERGKVNELDYIAAAVGGRYAPGQGQADLLLDWNFGPGLKINERPVLMHQGLDKRLVIQSMAELKDAVEAGALTPTNQLESMLRSASRMPAEDDIDRPSAQRLAGRQGGIAPLIGGASAR